MNVVVPLGTYMFQTAISLVSIFSSSAFHPAGYALSFCSILLTILYNVNAALMLISNFW